MELLHEQVSRELGQLWAEKGNQWAALKSVIAMKRTEMLRKLALLTRAHLTHEAENTQEYLDVLDGIEKLVTDVNEQVSNKNSTEQTKTP